MSTSNPKAPAPTPLPQRLAILRAALSYGRLHEIEQAARGVLNGSPPSTRELADQVQHLIGAARSVEAFTFISEILSDFAFTESFDKGCHSVCQSAGAKGDLALFDLVQDKFALSVYCVASRYKAIIAAAAAGQTQALLGLLERDAAQPEADAKTLRDEQSYRKQPKLSEPADLFMNRETAYRHALIDALRYDGPNPQTPIVAALLGSGAIDFENPITTADHGVLRTSELLIYVAAEGDGNCFHQVLDYLSTRPGFPSPAWFQPLRLRIAADGRQPFVMDTLLKYFDPLSVEDRIDLFQAAASTDNVGQARMLLRYCQGGPEIIPALNNAIRQGAEGVAKLLIEGGLPDFEPEHSPLAAAVLYHRPRISSMLFFRQAEDRAEGRDGDRLGATYALALLAALAVEPMEPHKSRFIAKLFRKHGFPPPDSEDLADPLGSKRASDFASIAQHLYERGNADPYMQPEPESGLWHSAVDLALLPQFPQDIRDLIIERAMEVAGLKILPVASEPAPRSRRPR